MRKLITGFISISSLWLAVVFLAGLPCLGQIGGFGGPAVLSRGTRPQGREGARPIYLNGHVSVGANYTTGLNFPGTNEEGNLVDEDSFGAFLGFGVSGNRRGRRDNFFGSYTGSYQLYRERYYSGLQQGASLAYSRQLARRWNFYLAQSASTTSSQFNNLILASTDLPTAELPDASFEIVDNRIYMLSSAAGFNYQKSARMSFNFSGGAMFQRRHSSAFASSNGFLGSGSMNYMVSRRSQIGVSYSYGTYYLTRGYGEMQVMSTNVSYGRILTPRWFFNASGGVYESRSKRVIRVTVDPFIAFLTGQNTTQSLFDGKRRGLSASASLAGRFRRAGVSFYYSRGVTPGNGIFWGAEQEVAGSSIGLNSESRFGLSFSATWARIRSLTQELGRGQSYGANANMSYRLFSFLHASGGVGLRRWEIGQTDFQNDRFIASAGISFGSPRYPLALW